MNIISRTSRTSVRVLAAAATVLAVSYGAYAAGPQSPGPGPGDPPGAPGVPWHHHGGFMMKKELADLHAKLKLTSAQDKLWQTAVDTMQRDGAAERANHEKVHAQLKAMQQQPILDFNALHAAHEQVQQDDSRLREEMASAWLAVYNALDDQQKTIVSDVFKQHFAKMESMREHMREHWGHHGGPGEPPPANP